MAISIFLARIIGVALIIIYGSVLLNRVYFYRTWQDVLNQPLILFISGFLALILGLLITQVHNIWVFDWRLIITLIGWLLLFQGIMRILFPETVLRLARKMFEKKQFKFVTVISGILFLLGIFLTYVGYTY